MVGVDDDGSGVAASIAQRGGAQRRRARTRSSGSGASQRNGSSGPAVRGTLAVGRAHAALEGARRVLERLALEQPGEEQVALLEAQQLLVELEVLAAGQQAAGLELDERRGDEQELGGDVEIERVHALDLGEVRVDDLGERDLPEVDLLLEDEVQEEVERALEDRGADLVRHRGRAYRPPTTAE